MKNYFSPEAASFLKLMLERNPTARLGGFDKVGNETDDAHDIRSHPFFEEIDWQKVRNRTHRSPFIPRVQGPEDTSCIDQMFTREELTETMVDHKKMMKELNPVQKKQTHFKGFTYEGSTLLN
mmetsp:Transcript_23062/g.35697  ORF Transcript_23062/g.35697 Transcript_23062/m.35697 type:complete len:123 (+) Transcript_23062:936-1304(+)